MLKMGLTGAQAAAEMLRREGVTGVEIVPTRGFLSDHYNPMSRKLALSEAVYSTPSVAVTRSWTVAPSVALSFKETARAEAASTSAPEAMLPNTRLPPLIVAGPLRTLTSALTAQASVVPWLVNRGVMFKAAPGTQEPSATWLVTPQKTSTGPTVMPLI